VHINEPIWGGKNREQKWWKQTKNLIETYHAKYTMGDNRNEK